MRLLKNIITLMIWQGSIFLVPMLTTPYLARVLGVTGFGALAIAAGLVGYLYLVIDWGFSMTGTREVARHADNPAKLSQIFWDILLAKMLLGAASMTVLTLIVTFTPGLSKISVIFYAYEIQAFAAVFNVGWFLQGLERMGSFAIASLIGRFLTVPLTFLLVHGPRDIAMAALIQGGTLLISSAASIGAASKWVPLKSARLDFNGAKREITNGFSIFLSTGGITLYNQSSMIVLGFVAGPAAAGIFSGADRIRRAAQGMTAPISQASYPRMNRLIAERSKRAKTLLWLLFIGQAFLTLVLSVTIFVTAPYVTLMFLGPDFLGAATVLRWLSPIPFICGISNVLGVNMMLPLGMNRQFTAITLACSAIHLPLLIPLVSWYGATGAAAAVTLTEILVTTVMGIVMIINFHRFHAAIAPLPIAQPA